MAVLSPRPELLVGLTPVVGEPAGATLVGRAGPRGRDRMLFALPLNGAGPVEVIRGRTVTAVGARLADADGALIGDRGTLWIHRLLSAAATEDTRR